MNESKQFHISRQFQAKAPWISLFLLGMIVSFLFLAFWDMEAKKIPFLLVAAFALAVPIWVCSRDLYLCWYADKYTLTVDMEGIELRAPRKKDIRLVWSDITEVTRPSGRLGAVMLKGISENSTLRLETGFDGWNEIVTFLEQTPAMKTSGAFPATFQFRLARSFLERTLYLAIACLILLVVAGPPLDRSMIVMLFVIQIIFQFASLESLLRGPRNLVVDTLGFSFRRGAIKGRENFADVTAISLRPTISGGELSEIAVVATLPRGKELSLYPPTCDPFAVYRALRTVWELSQTK